MFRSALGSSQPTVQSVLLIPRICISLLILDIPQKNCEVLASLFMMPLFYDLESCYVFIVSFSIMLNQIPLMLPETNAWGNLLFSLHDTLPKMFSKMLTTFSQPRGNKIGAR
jgi:hypothetical protein